MASMSSRAVIDAFVAKDYERAAEIQLQFALFPSKWMHRGLAPATTYDFRHGVATETAKVVLRVPPSILKSSLFLTIQVLREAARVRRGSRFQSRGRRTASIASRRVG